MSEQQNSVGTGLADGEGLPVDRVASLLGLALSIISLVWILDLHTWVNLSLFNEQPLALAVGLAFAIVSASLGFRSGGVHRILGLVVGAVLLGLMALIAWRYPQLTIIATMRPLWLTLTCVAVLGALLVLVWRTIGLPIVIIVAAFSLLALYGSALGIPITPFDRWAIYMTVDPNGLLGLPVRVAVEIVIPFVLFGELLRQSGGSDYLTRVCLAIFGRYRGGSAKAAIGASALFGTISGNAVSNVVATGVVTIPLMKRTGMKAETAAAVEAAASTGGQLLPPVMGAAAFVMADYLQVLYLEVAVAAALPALLYYAALFLQVDRIAARSGAPPLEVSERASFASAFREGGHFLLPFVALFYVLFSLQTRPQLAALAAIATLLVVGIIRPYNGRRLNPASIVRALVDAGVAAAPLLLITATAGLIIGLVSLTGLGFSIAAQAIAASGGNTFLLLALVAAIAIVFGMGMPTVAVYVVLATILAPALVKAGLAPMQAHLFILYFGMMSMLTPPVALASITAAKIGGAGMWRTSFVALRLAWVAYLVPFLFAYSPEMLLGGTAVGAALAALTAFGGITAVSMAAVGYARDHLTPAMRAVYLLVGVCLMLPPTLSPMIGLANLVAAAVLIALLLRPRSGNEVPLVPSTPSSAPSNNQEASIMPKPPKHAQSDKSISMLCVPITGPARTRGAAR